MKMAKYTKLVLVSCIINVDDIQVSLRLFSLSLNACKVITFYLLSHSTGDDQAVLPAPQEHMMVFFKFWPESMKKASITLQALRTKLISPSLNETCLS